MLPIFINLVPEIFAAKTQEIFNLRSLQFFQHFQHSALKFVFSSLKNSVLHVRGRKTQPQPPEVKQIIRLIISSDTANVYYNKYPPLLCGKSNVFQHKLQDKSGGCLSCH
jgi:hypothetical protein